MNNSRTSLNCFVYAMWYTMTHSARIHEMFVIEISNIAETRIIFSDSFEFIWIETSNNCEQIENLLFWYTVCPISEIKCVFNNFLLKHLIKSNCTLVSVESTHIHARILVAITYILVAESHCKNWTLTRSLYSVHSRRNIKCK